MAAPQPSALQAFTAHDFLEDQVTSRLVRRYVKTAVGSDDEALRRASPAALREDPTVSDAGAVVVGAAIRTLLRCRRRARSPDVVQQGPGARGDLPGRGAGPTVEHMDMAQAQVGTSRTRARTWVTVQSSESTPFDQTEGPALLELRLSERFTGDLEGESPVRALQVMHDRSASLVSVQRFHGSLGGRRGTFVLQGTEVVENGKIHAKWLVVPGSGTDGLAGLRGEGGFEGEFGKGSEGTLDYWFE